MSRTKFVYEPNKLKHCNKCGVDKPQSEFYRRTTGYLVTPCAQCCKDAGTENARKYGANKGPKAQARKKKWLANNRDKRNAWQREHYAKQDTAKRNEYLNRTGKGREIVNRRRARKANAQGSHTEREWLELCMFYGYRCVYPGCMETRLTRDHVVPLSKGGSDYIDNIQPLCQSHNSSKLDKEVDYR